MPPSDVLEDRALSGAVRHRVQQQRQVTSRRHAQYERLPLDFAISPGVVVPAGGYSYADAERRHTRSAQQRKVSGTISASCGSFYDGTRTTASYSGRIGVSPHVAIEPNVTLNWVELPYGDFNARLLGMRFVGVAHRAARIQLAHAVQPERAFAHVERAHALGIHARQRAVRGLQRRPRHGRRSSRGCRTDRLRSR